MSENTTETATHEVILTDVAAQKVKSLLEQEGRDDLRLRVPSTASRSSLIA